MPRSGARVSLAAHVALAVALATATWLLATPTPRLAAATSGSDWATYLHDGQRSAFDSADNTLSSGNAAQLVRRWSFKTGSVVAASAAIVHGVVYVGSWDGYEYALSAATGGLLWKTFLGTTTGATGCSPQAAGVSSSATFANGVVYVGGGDAYWYALDAGTGAVLWRVFTGDNSAASGHYNWSSPLVVNGSAYIGVSSLGDCPLVQGELLRVDLASHAVVATFKVVPDGQVGGGIWTSPVIDAATNTIFVTTGTTSQPTQTLTQAVLALDANTLALRDSWQLPQNVSVEDSDWGTSPILLEPPGGTTEIEAINKNGIAYAFDEGSLSTGPVWQHRVAYGGNCPTCGDGSVSSGSVDANRLILAGGNATIAGFGYPGSVRAVDPSTGAILWAAGASSPVIGAVATTGDLVLDGAGATLEVRDLSTGTRLFAFTTGGSIYGAPAVSNGVIITGGVDGMVNAFGLPANPPAVPPTDAACPSSWTCQDIGNPRPPGREVATGSSWAISVGGTGIGGTADHFRLISQTFRGDVQVTASVQSITSTSTAAQAAVMVRQSADPGSPEYTVMVTNSRQVTVEYRTTFGGTAAVANQLPSGALPVTLMIQRSGDHFAAATSTDGVSYTLIPGTSVTIVMPLQVMAGVGVSSALSGTPVTAVMTGASAAVAGAPPSPPASPSACPAGWSCADVGNPKLVGDQTLTGSTWTLTGSGNDVFGYADQFHFVWQQLAGDTDIRARVVSQSSSAAWAKAGVMLRQSVDPGAPEYSAFLTPGNGVVIQYRPHEGLRTTDLAFIPATAPVYLQVARSQNVFSAYTSSDGASWAVVVGSSESLDVTASEAMLAGVAVTSHTTTATNSAGLDNVSVSATPPPPPNLCAAGWACADIGGPTPAGSQTLSGTTWYVQGGGTDVWNTADQFRFESQPLSGDGAVTVRVLSQTFTDPWAKAGVMLRQTSDADSAFYALLATPRNGIAVDIRPSPGAAASMTANIAGAPPEYLEIARSGTTFSAYTSTDGTTWTLVPGSMLNLSMTGSLLAGMAVTSHNSSAVSTVAFDTVVISGSVPTPPPCPSSWTCPDVGEPTIVGTQSVDNTGRWTVVAGGADIWGTADQFHLVAQSLDTSPTVVSARVASQTNTDSWAKAGVIMRQDATAGAVYYGVFVTPANGVTVQVRPTAGAPTQELITVAGVAPEYVRIDAAGGQLIASTSQDGATWTPIAGSTATVAFTAPLLAGMAATSHNTGTAVTDVFDTVVVQ